MHLAGHFFRNVPRTVKYLDEDPRRGEERKRKRRRGERKVIEHASSRIAARRMPGRMRERERALVIFQGWSARARARASVPRNSMSGRAGGSSRSVSERARFRGSPKSGITHRLARAASPRRAGPGCSLSRLPCLLLLSGIPRALPVAR